MANFKMRANICTYFKNADPLVSSAQNIDILSGSPRSEMHTLHFSTEFFFMLKVKKEKKENRDIIGPLTH